MNNQSTPAPKTSRAEVLRLTWQITKNAGLSFATALKQAWATIRLRAKMLVEPTEFTYIKEDGTKRVAVGHLASEGKTSLVVRYFDTLADNWRSFRVDRLVIA